MGLFNVTGWSSLTSYEENDIVSLTSGSSTLYYYAISGNLNTNPTGAGAASWSQNFIWRPSYSSKNEVRVRTLTAQFGDGYSQRQRDGINNVLSVFDLYFENRSDKEAKAIMHFLEQKGGVEAFPYQVSNIYASGKYVADSPKHDYKSFNVNDLSVMFKQVPEL